MVRTTNDAVERFSATTGYTHSDELTLIFRPKLPGQSVEFGGRVPKLLSLVASYVAARFNHHLKELVAVHPSYSKTAREVLCAGDKMFDCRLLVCE